MELEMGKLLLLEIADQYKTFNLLQHYLHQPSLLVSQGEYIFQPMLSSMAHTIDY